MAASRLAPSLICVIGFISSAFGGEIQSALDDAPRGTLTTTGIHGDPINLALIGTKHELIAAMLAAKWQPADPITVTSSAKLIKSVRDRRVPDEA